MDELTKRFPFTVEPKFPQILTKRKVPFHTCGCLALFRTKTSSFIPNNSARPLFKQIGIFPAIRTAYFKCKYFSLYARASRMPRSGFRRGSGNNEMLLLLASVLQRSKQMTQNNCIFRCLRYKIISSAYFFASDFCFFYIEKKLKVVSITNGLSTFT